MEFRWIALITLWTLVAGPIFDSPLAPTKAQQVRSSALSSRVSYLPGSPNFLIGVEPTETTETE